MIMTRHEHLEDAALHAETARLLAALLLHVRRVPEQLLRQTLEAIVRHAAYAGAVTETLSERVQADA
ncbi:MAG: hypothetical protein ACK4MJ_07775 [Hylemonella sp.]